MPFYQWLYITVFTYRKKKKKKRKEKKKRLYTEFLYFESMFLALLGFMLLPSLQSQLLLVFSFNPSCTGKIFALLWLKVCIYLLRPAFSSSSSFFFFFSSLFWLKETSLFEWLDCLLHFSFMQKLLDLHYSTLHM